MTDSGWKCVDRRAIDMFFRVSGVVQDSDSTGLDRAVLHPNDSPSLKQQNLTEFMVAF